MRKVILGLGISIDGYIARLNGAVDFLYMPKDYSMVPFIATIDTAIMGRKTLDAGGGSGSLSGWKMDFYIFSRSQPAGVRNGITFVNEDAAVLIHQLRQSKGKDIWLMGGGELASEFLREDLVDELNLGIVPVLLGEGIRLFPGGFPQRNFALLENKRYAKGLISLKYRLVRSKEPGDKTAQRRGRGEKG